MRSIVLIALLAAPGVAGADEVYRLVSDAKYGKVGADGSVFVLTAQRAPTPGAWMQDCISSVDSLTRMDGKTGAVQWSTCLPVSAESLAVDARGAVTIVGVASSFALARATPGAYTSRGDAGIAVIRLNPAGSGPEWIANVAEDSSYPYVSGEAWSSVGPDGSVYGAANVTTTNLPVTEAALATAPLAYFSGYFLRLSADGSRLLYATYVNEGSESNASGLAVDDEGSVFVGGACSSFALDYRPSMATPGTFTTTRRSGARSAWVARFDPDDSAFRYVSVFGQVGVSRISLASAGRGRVAIAGSIVPGLLTPTAGAFFADRGATTGDPDSFVVVLNAERLAAEVVASYGVGSVRTLESDANGDLIVAGEAFAVTTTVNAWRLVGNVAQDSNFVLKLAADGTRVLYATGLGCRSCAMQSFTRAGDALWIAVSNKSEKLTLGATQPLTVQRPEMSMLRALPDNWTEGVLFGGASLSWDTRDPAALSAEIRLGAPNGPVVARGTTGAIALTSDPATYYFVDTTGVAVSGQREMGVEKFTRYKPLGGYADELSLDPNPVLSCREAPLSGTQMRVRGLHSGTELMELHVGAPDGPVLTSGWGVVYESTGDWVRNGMPFFLTRNVDSQVFGSVRAYLLPNRSCTSDALPEPLIRATRDCVQKDRFTLAWYAGTAPVEIREGSASGPKVGRFKSDVGMLDVTAATAKSYWLMSWENGDWKPIASTVADPAAPCEQGVVR